ncbi:peptidoglycan-binding protein [Anaerocolumna sedimenticola]|uniref:peptidoglycan-binding protein n=1 Tax=Anaerocolumna sedimenticola TaxID=2696063 RepID=UPI001FE511A7|nr:peptidoglycan-binding protein [Anaerocolumna sedimenticola]
MGRGNLIIQVRTSTNSLPISGARIKITDQEGTLLYDLITDESGQTQQISLEAADRELSLDPHYTGTPYTTYQLDVEAPGFNNLHIVDVQIFDGENAIQPVALIPMLERQTTPMTFTVYIGKHAVEMTEPRNQAGPLIDPFVLRHVIIPNPITVHLGTPASDASNVQVPFIDYVKNVASSEIFPTWPQSALEANIYAIITFALNRVFTEWYRNRGYNFDITNSTAYDQYFVYGRTIYESISVIVDRIFNQYVRRQDQIAPFFTSFCNGTTATCAGLSQWGTVSLSNQGKSAIQILRYYYPDDIEISQTNIITGIVVSYPGTSLKLGSTGLDVLTIQTYLNRIRRNYPAIPVITDEPGKFGNTTKAAVTKFQSIFNLTADGVVGKATWNKISSIYVAVTKLAELTSEGTSLGIGTVPPVLFSC